jgi:transposase
MDMQKETEITLAWELHGQGISQAVIARRLGRERETIRLWVRGIQAKGLKVFLDSYGQGKREPRPVRQVDALIKLWVWRIREREHDCCGQKIAYFLAKEHDVKLSVPKIYEVLAEKYVIRSKWKKNQKRGLVPEASQAREVLQFDTIDFGGVFAFTAVDIWSKEADVLLRPALTSQDGLIFLQHCMGRRFGGYTQLLQTDGGSEFKDKFLEAVHGYCDRHRVARPYKKNEQSYIESFNRTVRKECLGWSKYQVPDLVRLVPRVEAFLERYHYHRPHLGFEPMRPPLTHDKQE